MIQSFGVYSAASLLKLVLEWTRKLKKGEEIMPKDMGRLDGLLKQFREDRYWNTVNADGSHRFDKELVWIETMVKDYAEKLDMTTDEVVELMESHRNYSWPNYYQPANFPGIDSKVLYGVFDTFKDFRDRAKRQWSGYKCPKCGTIGPNPQECSNKPHCDWCSYGLLQSGYGVVIKDAGLKLIPIFEPVPLPALSTTNDDVRQSQTPEEDA